MVSLFWSLYNFSENSSKSYLWCNLYMFRCVLCVNVCARTFNEKKKNSYLKELWYGHVPLSSWDLSVCLAIFILWSRTLHRSVPGIFALSIDLRNWFVVFIGFLIEDGSMQRVCEESAVWYHSKCHQDQPLLLSTWHQQFPKLEKLSLWWWWCLFFLSVIWY